MNNASKLRLSLRKLLIATMAVGPLAVLPSPVWAVLPTASSFTVTNGSATVTSSSGGTIATISTTDRAVLVWGNNTLQSTVDGTTTIPTATVTNFYIGSTETYNFALPPGGSVLNRVKQGAGEAGKLGTGSAAVINGTLLSDGKVFVLSDSGNITVNNGAVINTAGGLILSTLSEPSDGPFTSNGDLLYTDNATTSNITLGSAVVTGNLSAYGRSVTVAGLDARGDLVLRNVGAGVGNALGTLTVGGNLSVTTNQGAITQTGATVVGFSTAGTQTANFSTSDGAVAINLGHASNNFETLSFSTGGGAVTINDVSAITLGASTTNSTLTVTSSAAADSAGINFYGGTAIATSGAVNVLGNAQFTSAGHNSAISIGNNSSVGGTLSATTANGSFTFNGTGNTTTGNLTVGSINSSTVATSTVTRGGLTINATTGAIEAYPLLGNYIPGDAGGTIASTLPTIAFNAVGGGAGATGQPQFFRNASATIPIQGNLTANTSIATANTASATAPTLTGGTGYNANATVTYTGGTLASNGGAITIQSTGNVIVTGTLAAGSVGNVTTFAAPAIGVRGTSVTISGAGSIGTTGGVTLNATAGNVSIAGAAGTTIRGATLAAIATGGSITQDAGRLITTTNLTGTSTVNATNSVTLGETNDLATGSTLAVIAGGNSTVKTDDSLVLGTINAASNLSVELTAGSLTLGRDSGSLASVTNVVGNLTLTAPAGITDNNYSPTTIGGALNVTTTNANVVLDAATANGVIAPRVSLGQINAAIGTGALSVAETTTINLGNVTAASVTVNSTTGGVVDSGNLTVTGTLATTVASGQSAVFDGTNNVVGAVSFTGGASASYLANSTVSVSNTGSIADISLSSGGTNQINLGTIVAGNLTVNSGGKVDVVGTTTAAGNLTVTSADTSATAINASTGKLIVGNTATFTTTGTGGGITLNAVTAQNEFNSVVINGNTGAIIINDIDNLTVSGTSQGAVTVRSGQNGLVNTWNLVLGNLTVNSLVAVAGNGGSANSGTITQAAGTTIRTEGTASFTTTNGTITINNTGNNFGPVSAATGSGSAGISIRESGSLRVASITNNGANTTLTSETGSIIEQATATTTYTTTNGTLTLNAVNGSINLGGATRTSGTTNGGTQTVVANAPTGAVQLTSNITSANFTLGNITANSLSVAYSGNRTLTQSGRINVYGATAFTSSNTGAAAPIVLTNATNNFGRISLTTGNVGSSISITEAGTLNLGTVSMPAAATANFTATSVSGDIIDTGLAGVKLGGTVASVGTGVVTLTASSGNIVLDDPTTDFPTTGGVAFNAKNVTFSPLGAATLFLGASGVTSVAETLTVTSATGAINQPTGGNLSVTGDVFLQTGNQPITLTQAGNQFGPVRFVGSQVKITEASDLVLVTGSAATGLTEFVSGGNVSILNRGGIINLGSSGTATTLITAAGSIVLPKLVQATGTITLSAAGTKDLSALSLSADLSSKAPNNLGTGTYLPPTP